MKFSNAIKVLTDRIEKLQTELKKEEEIMENPEMMAEYHFAKSNAGNIELNIIELTGAIDELRKFPSIT